MIVTKEDLGHLIPQFQKTKKRIVFTNGCFDLLHIGHIRYLKEAQNLGDVLIVGLNSDSSVKRLKGENRPIYPQEERAEILASLRFVDYVVIFDEDTPQTLIELVQPDVLVKGGDWPIEKIVGADIVLKKGGKVFSLPYVDNHSTTNTIQSIIQKNRLKESIS